MTDQTCTTCGSSMPTGATFCTQCGTRTPPESVPQATPSAPPEAATPPPAPVTQAAPPPPAPSAPTQPVAPPPPAPSHPTPHDPTQVVSQPAQADPTQLWQSAPATPVQQPSAAWGQQPAPHAPPQGPPPQAPPAAAPSMPAPPMQAPPTQPPFGHQAPPAPAPGYPPAPQQAMPPAPNPQAPYGAQPPYQAAAPATTTGTKGGAIGAIIALVGGAAVIAGSFLTWMAVTPTGEDVQNITGWALTDDAKIMVAIGAVGLLGAVLFLAKMSAGLTRLLMAAAGIGALALGAFDTYDILKRVPKRDDIMSAFPYGAKVTGPEIGLIVIFAGGAALLVGALLARRNN